MAAKIIGTIVSLCALVGMVVGGLNYFAKAAELEEVREYAVLVELRLDQKIIVDRQTQVQERMWRLEDRYKGAPCSDWQDPDHKEEYRKLKQEKELLDLKIQKLSPK